MTPTPTTRKRIKKIKMWAVKRTGLQGTVVTAHVTKLSAQLHCGKGYEIIPVTVTYRPPTPTPKKK